MKKNKVFLFDFSKILGAAFLAQLIPLAISPIISRLYSVEDFGIQGIIVSIVGFCWIFSTLRYDNVLAIDRTYNPLRNFITVKKIVVLSSIAIAVIFVVFIKPLSGYFKINDSYILLLIPGIVFINSSYELLIIYNNRIKNFDNIAKIKVAQSTASGTLQLAFGFMGFNYLGLILAPLVSKFLPYFKSKLIRTYLLNPTLHKKDLSLIRKYKKFPYYDLPASLINNVSLQLPIILFASKYSMVVSGAYFMTQRVLQIPITLISHSFLEIFKEKISSSKSQVQTRKIMFDNFKLILAVSIIPFILLFFFVEDMIILFLGKNWNTAAEFAKILVPSLFFRFISYPLSYIILVKDKQLVNLIFNIISLVVVLLIFNSNIEPSSLVLNLSILFSVQSIVKIVYSFSLTKIK
jgi:O-antigen/teichoic acid export membrane protein